MTHKHKMVRVDSQLLSETLKLFTNQQNMREQLVIANLDEKLGKADSVLTKLVHSVQATTPTPPANPHPIEKGVSEFLGFYKLPELQPNQLFMCVDKGCDDIAPTFIEEDNHVVYAGCSEDPSTAITHRKYSIAQVCNRCHGELRIFDESIGDTIDATYQHFAPATCAKKDDAP